MKYSFTRIQKLFIYERREMAVLIILLMTMGLFSFTLGIHLGKDVSTPPDSSSDETPKLVDTTLDQVPTNQELIGPNKATQHALEESLTQNLHDEVLRLGLRLNPHFQTDLPEEAKTLNAGATTLRQKITELDKTPPSHSAAAIASESPSRATDPNVQAGTNADSPALPASSHATSQSVRPASNSYVIQIGSFPNAEEAEKQATQLSKAELKPFTKEVEVKGKGKWYRLYLGGFNSKGEAEKAGKNYIAEHKIESFIVSKFSD